MSYYPNFADSIESGLAKYDRSASWLAGRLKVNPGTVSRWLNEQSRPKSPEIVAQIAEILQIEKALLLLAAGYGYQDATKKENQSAPENQFEPNVEQEPHKKRGGGIHFYGSPKIQGDVFEAGVVHKTYNAENITIGEGTQDITHDENDEESSA